MTAKEIITLFPRARRTGKGRWMARCPVHGSDRHPSLSIVEGHTAILLRCWSHGCPPEAICESVGISMVDLWYQRETDPRAIRKAQGEQARQMERDRNAKQEQRLYADRARKWEAVAGALGKLLAGHPNDDKLGALFHASLNMMRLNLANVRGHPANWATEDVRVSRNMADVLRADVGEPIARYLGI